MTNALPTEARALRVCAEPDCALCRKAEHEETKRENARLASELAACREALAALRGQASTSTTGGAQ